MRQTQIIITVSLLVVGSLGAYWVATAQEAGSPWPPPPVRYEERSPEPPAAPPKSAPMPAHGESKAPPTEKKGGPIRKFISGVMSSPTGENGKPRQANDKGDVAQVIYQAGVQEIPPPTPAVPTIPPSTNAGGSPAGSSPAGGSSAGNSKSSAPMPPAPDLPSIPAPTYPPGPSPNEQKKIAPPPIALPPIAPPPMPNAEPPAKDPSKTITVDPPRPILPPAGGSSPDVPPLPSPSAATAGPALAGSSKPAEFVLFSEKKLGLPALPPIQPVQQPTPPPPVKTNNPTDAGSALLAVQTPGVTIEKRGPTAPRPGESAAFQIIVRNQGSVPAGQVRIEDELPADARILQADPVPQLQGSRAVWIVRDLPPGASGVLSLTLQAGASASMTHNTHISVMDSVASGTAASPAQRSAPTNVAGQLGVQVAGPPSVAAGRAATFDVTYSNHSNQRLNNLIMRVALSDGLRHTVGQSIEADIGELAPGSTKSVKITATAITAGRQGLQVRLAGPGIAEAVAQAVLEVIPAGGGLVVQQPASAKLPVGRTADLRIEVTNHSGKPMRHVSVVSQLPDGVEFVAASDHGLHQPTARTVSWLLDPVVPGESRVLVLRVMPKALGQFGHQVIARADGVPETKSASTLTIDGSADLTIDLQGDNAVELGREAIYEVRITNPGSSASANVRVELVFTAGLVPRKAEGPAGYRIDGQTVAFDYLPALAAQGQVVYRVSAMGQAAGDQRVRAAVVSDQVRTATVRERGTKVYRD